MGRRPLGLNGMGAATEGKGGNKGWNMGWWAATATATVRSGRVGLFFIKKEGHVHYIVPFKKVNRSI
ncbi:UNVERIFIED_CONTAM: hypothetical protein Slati_3756800 [Sesamum latifolium]|uniref:Uncharacterized protein n=1 Tax=Sesamum latifolium TaxID=2727402 RepID=A0AAW2U7P1_9LAMI